MIARCSLMFWVLVNVQTGVLNQLLWSELAQWCSSFTELALFRDELSLGYEAIPPAMEKSELINQI